MAFKDWHLAAMEEAGYMDTNTGLINRVANKLAQSPNDTIPASRWFSWRRQETWNGTQPFGVSQWMKFMKRSSLISASMRAASASSTWA